MINENLQTDLRKLINGDNFSGNVTRKKRCERKYYKGWTKVLINNDFTEKILKLNKIEYNKQIRKKTYSTEKNPNKS